MHPDYGQGSEPRKAVRLPLCMHSANRQRIVAQAAEPAVSQAASLRAVRARTPLSNVRPQRSYLTPRPTASRRYSKLAACATTLVHLPGFTESVILIWKERPTCWPAARRASFFRRSLGRSLLLLLGQGGPQMVSTMNHQRAHCLQPTQPDGSPSLQSGAHAELRLRLRARLRLRMRRTAGRPRTTA